jgi:hypothetical protein
VPKLHSIALPPDHWLVGDYRIRVIAIDPATGNEVPDVDIQNVTMQVESATPTNLDTINFAARPILVRQTGA